MRRGGCGFSARPTVRVDGRNLEPQAPEQHTYSLSCRVYRTEAGISGQPDEEWLRIALREAASKSA